MAGSSAVSSLAEAASDLKALMDSRIAFEILGQGFATAINNLKIPQRVRVQFETPQIGREEKRADRCQPVQALLDKTHMIALDIEGAGHAFGIREGGWIEKDHAVATVGWLRESE